MRIILSIFITFSQAFGNISTSASSFLTSYYSKEVQAISNKVSNYISDSLKIDSAQTKQSIFNATNHLVNASVGGLTGAITGSITNAIESSISSNASNHANNANNINNTNDANNLTHYSNSANFFGNRFTTNLTSNFTTNFISNFASSANASYLIDKHNRKLHNAEIDKINELAPLYAKERGISQEEAQEILFDAATTHLDYLSFSFEPKSTLAQAFSYLKDNSQGEIFKGYGSSNVFNQQDEITQELFSLKGNQYYNYMHDPNNPDSLGYRGLVYGTKTALETATLGLELASIYYTAGASAPAVFGKRVGSGVVRSMVNNISKTTQNTHSKGIINQSKIKKHTNIQNIKDKDALDDINKYLGKNQTNINPLTGKVDNNRIFGKQHNGTWRSVRIGEHEMKSDKNFHYHKEIVDLTTNKLREIDGGMTHILKTRKP